MKYFLIPAAVLAVLLGTSLRVARMTEEAAKPWREALAEAVASAERDDWDAALQAVRGTREAWDARKPWLHVVTAHDELDKVDALFSEAESFAVERDMGEFRAEASELIVQLGIIAELQKLTIRNIL